MLNQRLAMAPSEICSAGRRAPILTKRGLGQAGDMSHSRTRALLPPIERPVPALRMWSRQQWNSARSYPVKGRFELITSDLYAPTSVSTSGRSPMRSKLLEAVAAD
jgi:hypothetical protein